MNIMKLAVFFLLCVFSSSRSEATNKPITHGALSFDTSTEDPGGRRHLTQIDSSCPDGSPVVSYRCGCAILSAAEHSQIMSVSLNGAITCTPVCGEDDVNPCDEEQQLATPQEEDCSQYVCVHNNCGATELQESDIQIIRRGCEFNEDVGWAICSGGFTVDQPTYDTVSNGVCVSACGQPQLSCQFPARHGPSIFLDLPPSPSPNVTVEIPETPDIEGNCNAGQNPDGYICSCQVVTPEEMRYVQAAFVNQETSCMPFCGDSSELLNDCQRQDCQTDVCVGPRDNVQCAAFVERRLSDAINSFDCTDNEATNTVECVSGSSYVEVDQPSFNTISRGICLSACGMSQTGTRCRFNPVFRRTFLNETSSDETTAEPPSAIEPEASNTTEPAIEPDTSQTSEPAVEPDTSDTSEPSAEPETSQSSEPAEGPETTDSSEPSEGPETEDSSEPSVEPEASDDGPEPEPSEPSEGPETTDNSEPAVEPDTSDLGPEPEPSEPSEGPDTSDLGPEPEPSEPAIEPDVSDLGPEPEPSEPAIEPDTSDLGPEPEIEEYEIPASEPLPDAPESEVDPPDIEEPAEGPEAFASVFAPEPEVDICETIRRMRAETSFNEDSDEELFDAMIELPEECIEPSAAPSAFEPEPQMEPETSVPASEPGADEPFEEPLEEPEEPLEEPAEEPAEPPLEELEEPLEGPEEEPEEEPEVPPESAPASAPGDDIVQVPVEVGDSSNRVFATDWGECSQFCQQAATTATRERTVLCRNAFGLPLPAYQCDPEEFAEFESTEDCQLENCAVDGSYFVIGQWSTCSSSCAEFNPNTGELEVGVQTRDIECFAADGEQLSPAACQDLIPSDIDLERTCNSNPCEIVVLDISDWSSCSCTNSTQTRTVRCLTSSAEDVELERCEALGSRIPRTTQNCDPPRSCDRVSRKILQDEPSDSCEAVPCSNRGECNEGRCICEEGFGGEDCQLDLREEPSCPSPGILGPDGECCMSGVFDLNEFECCRGDSSRVQLDVDGNCCEGRLDNCGVCGGNGVLDSLGRCCSGTLDGNGLCCFSNNIDECGVCEGDGSSCVTDITATFDASARQVRRNCVEPYTDLIREALDLEESDDVTLGSISPIGRGDRHEAEFTIPGVQLDINSIEEALVEQSFSFLDEEPECAFTNLDINKHPVCGNGICEIGEAPSNADPPSEFECAQDCSMEFTWCELTVGFRGRAVSCSGHGLCLYANNGQCDCFTGYAGANCELCARGFYRLNESDTRCFPRQNFVSIIETLAEPPEEPPEIQPTEPIESPETAEPPEETEPTEITEVPEVPDAIAPTEGPEQVNETDPTVIVPTRRGFATINAQNTLESDDDDAETVAIVIPLTVVPVVLFLFVVYHYARKRSRDSVRESDMMAQKQKEASGYVPPGGPAKSESAMWKEFVSKLRPAARPTASRRRGLERLVNRSFQDSPSTSRSQLRPEGGSPGDYTREQQLYLGGTRGLMEDVTSPQSSLPSPAEVNPRADPRRRGIMDVRKWDSRKQSIKGSSALITVESSNESGSEHDELMREESGEHVRAQPRPATEIQGMTAVDEADRSTQAGVASSMEIHGVPSETAPTADTQSFNSD